MNADLLIIMARYPTLGRVKTRLAAEIGARPAVEVYRELLRHHAREFADAPFPVEWRYTPARSPFRRIAGAGARLRPQPEGSLGRRMATIFRESFAGGCGRVVMIGTDSPEMEQGTVRRAFRLLRSHPAVFQPTLDGGYALIGLREMLPVFEGIDWSTSQVMDQTRRRLRRLDVNHAELPVTFDIDTPDDLARWRKRS